MDWFDEMAGALAEVARLREEELDLPEELRDEILDLARIASHDSGNRINAPLLCYALGLAVGKGASLEELAKVVRAHTEG
jgi:phage regulator Rha-like protein